jgi:hypothetical protein
VGTRCETLNLRRKISPVKDRHGFSVLWWSTVFSGMPYRFRFGVQPIGSFIRLTSSVIGTCRDLLAGFGVWFGCHKSLLRSDTKLDAMEWFQK